MIKNKRKLYYYEIPKEANSNKIEVVDPVSTFHYEEAKNKQNFRLCDLEDLSYDGACGYWYKDGLIEIQEGIVKYYEKWEYDHIFQEKILIDFGYELIE